jgi:hypothetical protein
MPKTPMDKHERKQGKGLLAKAEVGCEFRIGIPGRDKPIGNNKLIDTIPLGKLNQIEKDI